MSDSKLPTLDEAMEAADILRGMLDDEAEANKNLRERVKELEQLLIQHDIYIPDYEEWHKPLGAE